jgi:hypothetical protein
MTLNAHRSKKIAILNKFLTFSHLVNAFMISTKLAIAIFIFRLQQTVLLVMTHKCIKQIDRGSRQKTDLFTTFQKFAINQYKIQN